MPTNFGRWKPFDQYSCRMGADRAESLNDDGQLFRGRHLDLGKLRQNGQPRHDFQQPLKGDHQPAGCRPEFIDTVAAHIGGFGNRAVDAVFNGNGFHVGIVGADIRTGYIDVAITKKQARKSPYDFSVRFGDVPGSATIPALPPP